MIPGILQQEAFFRYAGGGAVLSQQVPSIACNFTQKAKKLKGFLEVLTFTVLSAGLFKVAAPSIVIAAELPEQDLQTRIPLEEKKDNLDLEARGIVLTVCR